MKPERRSAKSLLIACLLLFNGIQHGFAQQQGAITPEILAKIKAGYKEDAFTKAIQNAVSNNDIRKLALNRENAGKLDHEFKYKVNVSGITDQKSSGRCWMFTGLNILRPKIINELNLSGFEFSTNYLYFWDQFEKANLFLENIIATATRKMDDKSVEWLFKNYLGDGGVWNQVVDLVQKYGIIPKEIMPETANSENTNFLQNLIREKLREDGLILREMVVNGNDYKKLQSKKIEMLTEVYRMLATGLGQPPEKFSWRYKTKDGNLSEPKIYTPVSFYKEFIKVNLNDYVMLMDDPTHDYYKLYEIEYDRDVQEGKNWRFINMPSGEIKEFAKKSLMENEPMYFSCDVAQQINKEEGTLDLNNYDYESLFSVAFNMNKKQRIQTFESSSTHGMALVGVDVDTTGKIIKWLLENSWGAQAGHNGYLTMTDEWFDEYMFRLVVLKIFIDEKILKILEQKPIMLPPWDPMFMQEE
ncbi:MAG: C1 family peptidase [Bacteroidia bacterium]|nr:C1 family peptidase [Bacteroidia bacterium]